MEEKQSNYRLVCPVCGLESVDDGFLLSCPVEHAPALLTTRYASRTLQCDETASGVYRYQCWLPDTSRLANAPGSVTYQSRQLNSLLKLPNLWIAFSGYWPERGARLETATFKELEVCGVLSRIPTHNVGTLVVASAGNTAAAFAKACSENKIPCLIVVPESGMRKLKFAGRLSACVKIICLTGRAAYSDAISFADRIAKEEGFLCEGGVRNIGRRDGMATAMLSAVEAIGKLPHYYFQAIGSGAGAIAAHEAAKRLVGDSRFGSVLPRLMLSQNAPFAPIYDSWKRGRRDFVKLDPDDARASLEKIVATVLSNQRPPYSIAGGIYDVLRQSRGGMMAVSNQETLAAMARFEKCEGIDIEPAAGVALAALIRAAGTSQIPSNATILLHITGGGASKMAAEKTLLPAAVDLLIDFQEIDSDPSLKSALALFSGEEVMPAYGPMIGS